MADVIHYGIWVYPREPGEKDSGEWLVTSTNVIFCTTSKEHAEEQAKLCRRWDLARVKDFESWPEKPEAEGES